MANDAMGRLTQVVSGGVTTKFLYDGDDLIAELDGAGAVLRRYVHGPAVDEPLVCYEGSGTTDRRWLVADDLGSVIAVTDGSGASTATNTYDEYGVPGSSNTGRFQYTGQTWLSGAGLYHYKARAYNPQLGRFMQTDPTDYNDGMNLYAYVRNDPVNWIDPMGLARLVTNEDFSFINGVWTLTAAGDPPYRPSNFFEGVGGPGGGYGRGGGGDGGGGNQPSQTPEDRRCHAPMSTYVGSARAVLEAGALGADVATLGLIAGGVTGPAALGTKALGVVVEIALLGINGYDAYANGNTVALEAQTAGFGARLLPGGRAFQGGLKAARGPTGILRNSRGQFRSSHLNNRGLKEAGDLAAQEGTEAAVEAARC